jgi:hypothetical protein
MRYMKAQNMVRVALKSPLSGGWLKRGLREGTRLTAVVPPRPAR